MAFYIPKRDFFYLNLDQCPVFMTIVRVICRYMTSVFIVSLSVLPSLGIPGAWQWNYIFNALSLVCRAQTCTYHSKHCFPEQTLKDLDSLCYAHSSARRNTVLTKKPCNVFGYNAYYKNFIMVCPVLASVECVKCTWCLMWYTICRHLKQETMYYHAKEVKSGLSNTLTKIFCHRHIKCNWSQCI